MKMIKTIMASAVAMVLVSFGVNAADGMPVVVDQGQGKITFKGKVIDAPCGIAPESADQTIDLGQVATSVLNADITNGGFARSQVRDVNITLVNCNLQKTKAVTDPAPGTPATYYKNVKLTFSGATVDPTTGVATHPNELNTTGGTGVAVILNSGAGNVDFSGATPAAFSLKDGDNTLHFTAWAQKATGVTNVTEGAFSAVTDFKLAYE